MHIFDDPLTYASRWLSGEYLAHPNEYGNALDRWLTYYEERGIAALASGALLMRRRDGTANWFQAFNVAAQTSSFCGDQLAQMFRIQDYCQRALPTDDALLNCRLCLREGTVWNRPLIVPRAAIGCAPRGFACTKDKHSRPVSMVSALKCCKVATAHDPCGQ